MKQEKINYDKIMALGFSEEIVDDYNYHAEHGYDYAIIIKQLTKTISLVWDKETKLCRLIRIDDPNTGSIVSELSVINLQHLSELIDFYSTEIDNTFVARLVSFFKGCEVNDPASEEELFYLRNVADSLLLNKTKK